MYHKTMPLLEPVAESRDSRQGFQSIIMFSAISAGCIDHFPGRFLVAVPGLDLSSDVQSPFAQLRMEGFERYLRRIHDATLGEDAVGHDLPPFCL